MFSKIKKALFPQSPPTEEQKKKERILQVQKKLGGPFNVGNNANEWYGYTFNEIHNNYFGYFHWQGQYFKWREQNPREQITDGEYNGEEEIEKAASLLLMGQGFANYFNKMKMATTEYPTPEEKVFMDATKSMWNSLIPSFTSMSKDQAIQLFFDYCLGPDTLSIQQEKYNFSCPFETTYLFHTNRTRCNTVEEARSFDQAYYEVFRATMAMREETKFSHYMDHPYTQVLAGSLNAPILLPGVEVELTLPDEAITHAKIELVILENLLAEKNARLREYLGMQTTQLSNYRVSTKSFAVEDSEAYEKFVKQVIWYARRLTNPDFQGLSPGQAMDWVLFCVPLMLQDIRATFESSDSDFDRGYSWENAPIRYGGNDFNRGIDPVVEKMKKNSDWLQKRREEMAGIFAQYPHLTSEKPPTPVVTEKEPRPIEATQKEVKAPISPNESFSSEMSEKEARAIFKFSLDEPVYRKDLKLRYLKFQQDQFYQDLQEELTKAYNVLLKKSA